jgi:FkbM family methyltransferase
MSLRNFIPRILRPLGLRVTRSFHPGRFQAMDDTLRLMRKRGFAPAEIIDAGANVGEWTLMVREIFPHSRVHMIEPQAGCAGVLQAIVDSMPGVQFHRVAVSEPGRQRVGLIGGGDSRRGTGAWVVDEGEEPSAETVSAATTLDNLFNANLRSPILLKLDLEGHEFAALRGAEALLMKVEAVLTEVRFFDVNESGRPVFSDLLSFLRERGFELYDVASLSGRPRDQRLRLGDAVFVRRDSRLLEDRSWD